MGEKGSKAEWIDYFTLIHGRAPSAAEIEAARDIYESGETEPAGAAEQSVSAAAGNPSEQPPVVVEKPDGDALDSDTTETFVPPAKTEAVADQPQPTAGEPDSDGRDSDGVEPVESPAESAVTVDQEQELAADEPESTAASAPADVPSAADADQLVSDAADSNVSDRDGEDGSASISEEPPVIDQPEPQPILGQPDSDGPAPDISAAAANPAPNAPVEPTAGHLGWRPRPLSLPPPVMTSRRRNSGTLSPKANGKIRPAGRIWFSRRASCQSQ